MKCLQISYCLRKPLRDLHSRVDGVQERYSGIRWRAGWIHWWPCCCLCG